uniref:Uncharacterized protein n=1 Tax=Plectus sambesii TaxID=2011161 RepID=A0A914X5V0_9BILA
MNSTIVNAFLVIAFAACVYSQCDPAYNQKCKRGNPLSTGQINSYRVCWCTNRAEQPCNILFPERLLRSGHSKQRGQMPSYSWLLRVQNSCAGDAFHAGNRANHDNLVTTTTEPTTTSGP